MNFQKHNLKFYLAFYIFFNIINCFSQVDFTLKKEFNKLPIKNKLFILKEFENRETFKYILKACKPDFNQGLVGYKSYYISDKKNYKKQYNKILITEYVFKDLESANVSYNMIYEFAEYARKLPRNETVDKCFSMLVFERIHYAIKNGRSVYLFNLMDYSYIADPTMSIDDIFKNDPKLLIDDFYLELIKSLGSEKVSSSPKSKP